MSGDWLSLSSRVRVGSKILLDVAREVRVWSAGRLKFIQNFRQVDKVIDNTAACLSSMASLVARIAECLRPPGTCCLDDASAVGRLASSIIAGIAQRASQIGIATLDI